jgi:tripartite-type tricarboxylate transporter receptor subunit TctC
LRFDLSFDIARILIVVFRAGTAQIASSTLKLVIGFAYLGVSMIRRRRSLALAAAVIGGPFVSARAQAWPTQAIKLVVTFPPGGSSDIVARLIGPALADRLGQSVVVDNRPGGAATIGAAAVARAAPDGYTLLMSNSAPLSISPAMMEKPLYDPLKSFRHLLYVGDVPTVIVTHPSIPVTDFASFVAWAKTQKDPIPFGSGGQASVGHIVGELLAQKLGLKMAHVPYKGAGPMRSDLLGGQIKMAVDALPQNLQFRRSGQLRLVAVTAAKRVAQASDLPTVVELGHPELVAENFVGISAPAGLVPAIEVPLLRALNQVMALPDIRSKLEGQGFELEQRSPDAFAAFIKEQADRWAPVVRASGARL